MCVLIRYQKLHEGWRAAKAAINANCAPNLTDNTRKFLSISSGVNAYRFGEIFKLSPTLAKMRQPGITAFQLADILRTEEDSEWDRVAGKPEDMLFILTRGSSSMKVILKEILDCVLTPVGKPIHKLMVVDEVPLPAFLHQRVLQSIRWETMLVSNTALFRTKERDEWKSSFRSSDEGTVTVLLLMYRVVFMGLNFDWSLLSDRDGETK